MKKFFGKKQILLATLTVALGAAVYLNYYFAKQDTIPKATDSPTTTTTTAAGNLGDSQYVNAPATEPDDTKNENDYFEQARKSRTAARKESLELLQETVNDVTASSEAVKDATEKIMAAAKAVEQEDKIESLIRSKGFKDCIVFIEGDNCNAVIRSEGLTAAQTLQITEIITAQSSVKSENIKISSVNS